MGVLLSKGRIRLAVAVVVAVVLYKKYMKQRSSDFLGFERKRNQNLPTNVGKIKELFIYPVKSCRPVKVDSVRITKNGMEYDRLVMILNPRGVPVTQRMIPELACVGVELYKELNSIRITSPVSLPGDMDNHLVLDLNTAKSDKSKAKRIENVDLHGIKTACVDFGDDSAGWLNEMLTKLRNRKTSGYRLVCIADGSSRNVHYSPARLLLNNSKSYDGTYLSDLCPLSFTSEASLAALNREIGDNSNVPMDRFRSNIVMSPNSQLDMDIAFVEDWFDRIKIGCLSLRSMGPIFRCVIPSVDQTSGVAGFRKNIKEAEPLKTLKSRRSGGFRYGLTGFLPMTMGGSKGMAPLFGVYLGVHEEHSSAVIKCNDPVNVIAYS